VSTPRLEARGIVKIFGRQRALDGVHLTVGDGEVVGLVGENGAGKSTLLNIASGVLAADAGELLVDGRPVAPRTYQEANRLGIYRVFQEPALIDVLPVSENLFFGWESLFRTRWGTLDRVALRRAARQALADAGADDIDVRLPAGRLSPGALQTVDIARVTALAARLGIERPIVLFDEPTTALDHDHEENFLRLLERLRGVAAVVFVSHRLPEILRTTERIVVLKDGSNAGEVAAAEADEAALHRLMVGRVRTGNYYRESEQRAVDGDGGLTVTGVSIGAVLRDVSITVRPGEVLGVAGTEGSGKRELGEVVAGLRRSDAGSVAVRGKTVRGGITAHVRAGIAYVPPDRARSGLIGTASIAGNIQLPSLYDRFGSRLAGVWRRRAARAAARSFVTSLGIVAAGIDAPIASLSGGNAQKVLLAKWLLREPQVLVLDAPTQGVDTGAREGIYTLIRNITAGGAAVLLISDDLTELIGLSHRIVVTVGGTLSEPIEAPAGGKPDEHDLIARMIPGATALTASRRHR
jgi:ribose transport system ATP-binding protein